MAYASCVLLLLQVITVLVSWVWGSVILDTNVSSLLTADGVRWFCSSLVDNVRSPLLIYILLIGLTAGQVKRSKILADLASFSTLPSFQRKAMTVALWEIAAILVVVAYLTLAPHAVLLAPSAPCSRAASPPSSSLCCVLWQAWQASPMVVYVETYGQEAMSLTQPWKEDRCPYHTLSCICCHPNFIARYVGFGGFSRLISAISNT